MTVLSEKRIREHADVLAPLAKRRQRDGDHRQAEEEVLAEAAGGDLRLEVFVGRRDHPGVHLDALLAAEPLDLSLLQEAQQLDLKRQAHLRDLVEEDGAVVGLLELAFALDVGPGVRAFFVAEELGLQQGLGDRAAIDGHERRVLAPTLVMDRARHQLLAGAALALNQDRHVGLGHERQHREDLPHLRCAADDLLEPHGRLGLGRLPSVLHLEGLQIRAPVQHRLVLREVDGFGEIVERAQLHGAPGIRAVAVAGHDDDLRRGRRAKDVLEGLQAFLGGVGVRRESEIETDDVRVDLAQERESLRPVVREGQRIAFAERVFELGADGVVVFHDQELRLCRTHRTVSWTCVA